MDIEKISQAFLTCNKKLSDENILLNIENKKLLDDKNMLVTTNEKLSTENFELRTEIRRVKEVLAATTRKNI